MIIVMNRTILIPLLLSTFLLVGCESEFDRCIEANKSFNYEEKYNKYISNVKNKTGDEYFDVWNDFDASLNSIEREVDSCVGESTYQEILEIYPTYNEWTEEKQEELWTSDEWGNMEKKWVRSCSQKPEEEEKEGVRKLCHAQGIY